MLEWGPGGTTRWLLDHFTPDQRLVSVEHSDNWEGPVRDACRHFANWRLIFAAGRDAPAAAISANATPAEENPVGLEHYVCPLETVPLKQFDVFLVDGIARAACLMNVLLNARPGARVWLHDVQRDWYGWCFLAASGRFTDPQTVLHHGDDYPAKLWGCTIA